MGQQQLLLVILVTIIVGIATVVAINIFGQASDQANRDAVRQDLMGAGVQAQAIWARPTLMDGANRDFGNFSPDQLLQRLNIPHDSAWDGTSPLTNQNGTYTVAVINDGDGLQITGAPSSGDPDIVLQVTRTEQGNWQVTVDGQTGESTED
ncbi:MAG: hypothetical protein JJU13_16965 [Balneolaceae bacterium]|nr:hypothetical protein [Balneolaceae bacterium]